MIHMPSVCVLRKVTSASLFWVILLLDKKLDILVDSNGTSALEIAAPAYDTSTNTTAHNSTANQSQPLLIVYFLYQVPDTATG